MAKKQPERMCIACRSMKPKRELFRVVVRDGHMVVDHTGKLPGRGAYLCKDRNCLDRAIKERRLEQHLKRRLEDEDLKALLAVLEAVEQEAEKRRLAAETAARLANAPAIALGDKLGQTVRIKKKGDKKGAEPQ